MEVLVVIFTIDSGGPTLRQPIRAFRNDVVNLSAVICMFLAGIYLFRRQYLRHYLGLDRISDKTLSVRQMMHFFELG